MGLQAVSYVVLSRAFACLKLTLLAGYPSAEEWSQALR